MDSPVPLERGQSESVGGNKPPPLPLPSKSQDPVGFDRMLSETPQEDSANKEEKADAKSGEPVRVRRKSVPNAGGRPRSLYERIVGKGTVFGSSGGKPMKRQSVGSAIANWFSKESPEVSCPTHPLLPAVFDHLACRSGQYVRCSRTIARIF